jgi:hypothetical protein
MRAFVLALALLAALKIWIQDSAFRQASEQALVAAYRDRAVTACRKEPQKSPISSELAAFATNWASNTEIHLSAGNNAVSVHLWQIDHELWNARYRNLYLMLTSRGLTCAYDIAAGTAEISRS